MKVKATISCTFEIEYDDQNDNIRDTQDNILMSTLDELSVLKTKEGGFWVNVLEIEQVKDRKIANLLNPYGAENVLSFNKMF